MGDEIAEDLGVIAEPEVIRKRIRPSDKVRVALSIVWDIHGCKYLIYVSSVSPYLSLLPNND